MRGEQMRRFWDDRAREDALFFVDNQLEYGDPDEKIFWTRGAEAVDGMLELLGGPELATTDHVVEIGCGVGRLTRELAARVAHVDALDVSEEMLARARAYNPGLENVAWIAGDGTSLTGIADASADACFSHVVFQHIPDPRITLGYVREMGRVLRPGGWAAFGISNAPDMHRPRTRRERLAARLRSALGREPGGQAHPAWTGSAVDLDELREAAGAAGMRLERVSGEGTQFCFALTRRDAATA